jgi:hypothetical protein
VAFDRYAYSRNNPINFTDPSGHLSCRAEYVAEGDCSDYHAWFAPSLPYDEIVTFSEDPLHPQSWTEAEMSAVGREAWVYASSYAATLNAYARRVNALSHETGVTADYYTPVEAFELVHGGAINFIRSSEGPGNIGWTEDKNTIYIYNTDYGSKDYIVRNPNLIGHELGHAVQFAVSAQDIPSSLAVFGGTVNEGYYGFHGGYNKWQFYTRDENGDVGDDEIFADMTIGWAYDAWWVGDPYGMAGAREGYMNSTMLYLLLFLASK